MRPALTVGVVVAGKLRRALTLAPSPDREGTCDGCSACCAIGGLRCPFLDGAGRCRIYAVRPPSCRIFPASPADLEEVPRCSYHFGAPPAAQAPPESLTAPGGSGAKQSEPPPGGTLPPSAGGARSAGGPLRVTCWVCGCPAPNSAMWPLCKEHTEQWRIAAVAEARRR